MQYAITCADKERVVEPLLLTGLLIVLPLREYSMLPQLARLWQRFACFTVPTNIQASLTRFQEVAQLDAIRTSATTGTRVRYV